MRPDGTMSAFPPRPARSALPLPAIAAFTVLLVTSGASAAQQDETRGDFEGVAQVVEVLVPVNVVSRDGTPVRGLTADDFRVYDQGKRREVVDFEVYDLEVQAPQERRPEDAVPAAARRNFLLLFDLSFSSPTAIVRAREAAREFVLHELHPTDLVAVGILTPEGGAELLVTFTPDRAQVARAIDTLGAPQLLKLARRDPLRFLIESPQELALQSTGETEVSRLSSLLGDPSTLPQYLNIIGKQMDRMEKSFHRGRVFSWSHALSRLARVLANIRGRKHVVYFSEGFDGRLLFGRLPSADDPEFQEDMLNIQLGRHWMVDSEDIYGSTPLQGDVRDMLEELRRADCAIQAVDISGLSADSAAERRAALVGQDALFYVANETGGTLFEDANDFGEQLDELLDQTSVTYLLAFRPSDIDLDGSYRRLKVKVRRELPKGTRVVARQGYYAPRPFDELHPLERDLLASDAIASAAPRSELAIDLLAAPFWSGEKDAYVPLIIEVQGKPLLAGHEEDQLAVEFYAYASDDREEMRDFFTQRVSVDLAKMREPLRRTGLKYYGHLELRPGDYLLRVLVRNAQTGRTGVATAPLQVPAFRTAEPTLLPPFFLEEPGSWFLVREREGESVESKTVVYPFTVNGEPYVPAARPAVPQGGDAELCLVAYNLDDGNLTLDGRVLSATGGEVRGGSLHLVERTATGIRGLDKLLASFRTDGLDPGGYTLEVSLTEQASGEVSTSSIPLTVVN